MRLLTAAVNGLPELDQSASRPEPFPPWLETAELSLPTCHREERSDPRVKPEGMRSNSPDGAHGRGDRFAPLAMTPPGGTASAFQATYYYSRPQAGWDVPLREGWSLPSGHG